MKFFIHMIIAALLLLIPATASEAFQNEPNGFRDLYWGESLQEVQQTRETQYWNYEQKNNSLYYTLYLNTEENKTIYEIPIGPANRPKFMGAFWNNKLWSVGFICPTSSFDEAKNVYKELKASFVIHFGPADKSDNSIYKSVWIGSHTYIMLTIARPYGVLVNFTSARLFGNIVDAKAAEGW